MQYQQQRQRPDRWMPCPSLPQQHLGGRVGMPQTGELKTIGHPDPIGSENHQADDAGSEASGIIRLPIS